MGVRYKELFALPGRQYALGAPVILEEAAQMLDQLTGRVYVRLLLQSIGQKPLSEVAVTVRWQDGEVQHHTWENPDGPLLIPAPHREARPFALTVDRVVADAVWRGTDALLKPLPEPALLETVLSPEQAAQYRESYGDGCKWVPERWEDLYLCSCGAVSRDALCGVCGKRTPMLTPAVLQDLEDMIAERRERERREREEALARQLREQEEARLRLEEAKRRKRARCMRMLRIAGITAAVVVCLAVLAAVGFYHVTRIAIPKDHYEKALAALEQGNYQEAHRQFTLAGKYEDAEEYLSRFSTPYLVNTLRTIEYKKGMFTAELKPSKGSGSDTSNTYDHRGLLLESRTITWEGKGEDALEKSGEETISYVYDEQGNCLEQWYNGAFLERETYDEYGSVLTYAHYGYDEVPEESGVYTYQYDEAGREISCVVVQETRRGGHNTIVSNYAYNVQGQMIRKEVMDFNISSPHDSSRYSESWEYDAGGRVVQYTYAIVFPKIPQWDRTIKEVYSYDGEGREILKTEESVHDPESGMDDVVVTTRTEYNEKGDRVREEMTRCCPDAPEENSTTVYSAVYDREGKLLEEKEEHIYAGKEENLSLGKTVIKRYEYDLFGRLTEKRERIRYPEGSQNEGKRMDIVTRHTYDSDGMLRETVEREIYADPQKVGAKTVTTYNENGLPEKVSFATEVYESVSEYTYAYFYHPDGEE